MSQRIDQRSPTASELDAYNKVLELTGFTFSVCKPNEKNDNHKHIPKRYTHIAGEIEFIVVEMGGFVLEANETYVSASLSKDELLSNYKHRIALQSQALRLSYRLEHYIWTLHNAINFADSTISHWVELLCNFRTVLKAWTHKDKTRMNKL